MCVCHMCVCVCTYNVCMAYVCVCVRVMCVWHMCVSACMRERETYSERERKHSGERERCTTAKSAETPYHKMFFIRNFFERKK